MTAHLLRGRTLLSLVVAWLCLGVVCAAEVHRHEDGAFEIDVPEGWGWFQTGDTEYEVTDMVNPQAVTVVYQCEPGWEQLNRKALKALLEEGDQDVVVVVTDAGGTLLKKRNSTLSGQPAQDREYTIPREQGYKHSITRRAYYGSCAYYVTGYVLEEGDRRGRGLRQVKKVMRTFRFLKKPIVVEEPSFDTAPRPADHESWGGQDGPLSGVEGEP